MLGLSKCSSVSIVFYLSPNSHEVLSWDREGAAGFTDSHWHSEWDTEHIQHPVCTLSHSHGWQTLCSGFVLLCWGLLAHQGWFHPSWTSQGIGTSWVSSKPYSKLGKSCEIEFQTSTLPVHTRGLLRRNQLLWLLYVLLVFIPLL